MRTDYLIGFLALLWFVLTSRKDEAGQKEPLGKGITQETLTAFGQGGGTLINGPKIDIGGITSIVNPFNPADFAALLALRQKEPTPEPTPPPHPDVVSGLPYAAQLNGLAFYDATYDYATHLWGKWSGTANVFFNPATGRFQTQ